jgi:hypothetical protein
MRDRRTRGDYTDPLPYRDRNVTWRSVGLAYGLMLAVLAILWTVSYPTVAATLLVSIVGLYAMVRVGTQRKVCIPTTDVCLTV